MGLINAKFGNSPLLESSHANYGGQRRDNIPSTTNKSSQLSSLNHGDLCCPRRENVTLDCVLRSLKIQSIASGR